MEINFSNKRALVTGAASGIGKGIAIQLAKCGAKVIAIDCSQEILEIEKEGEDDLEFPGSLEGVQDWKAALKKLWNPYIDINGQKFLIEKLKQEIPSCEIIVCDLTHWELTKLILKKALPVDLLVNVAGVCQINLFQEVTEQIYDSMFSVNMKALYNVTQAVVADMIKRNVPGSIVNISSQASQAGLLHHTVYCATKGAVDAFTRCLALELGPKNIRVNCVNPTVVMTELGKRVWSDPKKSGPMLESIPLGRFAEVEDVVNAVVYLLSDKASMTNGHCLPVDGGFLAC